MRVTACLPHDAEMFGWRLWLVFKARMKLDRSRLCAIRLSAIKVDKKRKATKKSRK
jgi:hypothetical protein